MAAFGDEANNRMLDAFANLDLEFAMKQNIPPVKDLSHITDTTPPSSESDSILCNPSNDNTSDIPTLPTDLSSVSSIPLAPNKPKGKKKKTANRSLPPVPIRGNINLGQMDTFDNYTQLHFTTTIRTTVFENYEAMWDYLIKNFPKVYVEITQGNGFFIKKNAPMDTYDHIKAITPIDTVACKDADGNVEHHLLWQMAMQFPAYSRAVYQPRGYEHSPMDFNTWVDFRGTMPGNINTDGLNVVLDLIRNIICNNNMDLYRYILSWLSSIVKTPYIKTGTALFFQSRQGTGKGTFGKFIRKHVLGSHCTAQVPGLDKILCKFNSLMADKILLEVDELPTVAKEWRKTSATLKGLITEETTTVERKGLPSYVLNSYVNYIFNTNDIQSLKIEESDRRYVCFKINEEKMGDRAYWKHVHSTIMTDTVGRTFYQYLMDIPEDDMVDLGCIPETELKREIQAMSEHPVVSFLKAIKRGEIEHIDSHEKIVIPKDGRLYFTPTDFNKLCNDWLRENGYKDMISVIKTSSIINEYTPSIRKKVKGKTLRLYSVSDIIESDKL